jgi:DNA-binding XRE family transcriptional regulator
LGRHDRRLVRRGYGANRGTELSIPIGDCDYSVSNRWLRLGNPDVVFERANVRSRDRTRSRELTPEHFFSNCTLSLPGLSQTALAKPIGTRHTSVSQWELGDHSPPLTIVPELAETLGVDVAVLFKAVKKQGRKGE